MKKHWRLAVIIAAFIVLAALGWLYYFLASGLAPMVGTHP